ncbi:MAG: tetratricopeptide repeat protein [Acidobacteria bacterium]|nr:tetratricopeptide repeat protein [Acidobacteriota bacterium]
MEPATAPPRIAQHVADCPVCRTEVEVYREVDAGLSNAESWSLFEDTDLPTAYQESIRSLAAQIAEEDELARTLLEHRIRKPAALAWLDVSNDPRLLSGGVVRFLSAAAHDALARETLDSLALADLAINVGSRLPVNTYAGNRLHDLRGNAWKERANALRLLGRYDDALHALDQASAEYAFVPASPLGPAIVTFIRASVYSERGLYDEAFRLAAQSARAFQHIGDVDRTMRARHLEANIHFHRREIRLARELYESILLWAESRNDSTWIARESLTLGHCALEEGSRSLAEERFARAWRLFEESGSSSESTRAQFGIGRVLLASGQLDAAVRHLSNVETQFRQLGLLTDAALVALHVMDAYCAQGDFRDIAIRSANLIETFAEAGMLTSALEAFAYLRESAGAGRTTSRLIEHVRQFVSRVEREPELLFAPPPDETAF